MKTMQIWSLALGLGVAAIGCVPGGSGGGGDGGSGGNDTDGDIPGAGGMGGMGGGAGGMGGGGPVGDTYDFSAVGSDDTAISELSPAQIQALCDAAEAQAEAAITEQEFHTVACASIGILAAAFAMGADPVATCQGAYDECLAQPLEQSPSDCPAEAHPDCAATLGQIEACLEGQVAQLKTFARTFDCSLFAEAEPDLEQEEIAACTEVEAACPGFFDDEEAP